MSAPTLMVAFLDLHGAYDDYQKARRFRRRAARKGIDARQSKYFVYLHPSAVWPLDALDVWLKAENLNASRIEDRR